MQSNNIKFITTLDFGGYYGIYLYHEGYANADYHDSKLIKNKAYCYLVNTKHTYANDGSKVMEHVRKFINIWNNK